MWGRHHQPILLLWGQHPCLLHVTMGRNWPSINTLAAPQARAEGCCKAQRGAALPPLPAPVLLQELGTAWAVLGSSPKPPCIPSSCECMVRDNSGFQGIMSSSAPCNGLQWAPGCDPSPYAAGGALPEAGRHHPAHSPLRSLPACLHIASWLLLAGNLHCPKSFLVALNVTFTFPALREN